MKKEKQSETENKVLTDNETLSDGNDKKEKAPKITRIGAMLKEVRQQKGLKLVDIAKKLCIRKCYLEAIEESNYSEIPVFPYGNGFIRSYANFLGLNGDNIIELYKEETSSSKEKNINVLEPQAEATMPNIQHILISLLAIALIYAGWFFYGQSNENNEVSDTTTSVNEENINNYDNIITVEEFNNETIKEAIAENPAENQIVVSDEMYQETPVVETESETETKKEDNKKTIKNNAVEEIKKLNKQEIPSNGVFVEVLKTTWVEVKDKDKLYLSKVLQPGESYKVPEGEGKILSVGKHDGVNIYVNGVLTNIVRPQKKINILLDKYINPEL